MATKKCERCGSVPKGEYELLDYCATCSKDLCEDCMEHGCCGRAPAQSGNDVDFGDKAAP
jgi:hypothetical protein